MARNKILKKAEEGKHGRGISAGCMPRGKKPD